MHYEHRLAPVFQLIIAKYLLQVTMEQPTIFSLLLICGVFLSASASPLIPVDKIPQQLPENPEPEAEEAENVTVVNEDKR